MTTSTIHPQIDKVLDKLKMANEIYTNINENEISANRVIYKRLLNHTKETMVDFAHIFKVDQSEIELSIVEKSQLGFDKLGVELKSVLLAFSDKKMIEYCVQYEEMLNEELRQALEEAAFIQEEREALSKAITSSTLLLQELKKEQNNYPF